jgi:membrane protein required for colicin V production
LCIAITFFAVTLLPPAQGEAIVNSQSGRYIVAILDKSHTVFPPEIHQIIDPYVNKVEQRLNPNFQPHGQDLQNLWPAQAQSPASQQPINWPPLPQISWPQSQPSAAPSSSPQLAWPPSTQSQPAWPPMSQQPPAQQADPRAALREPNPFPDGGY